MLYFNFVLDHLPIPYSAYIVIHEKIGIYAYFSIIEIILNLAFNLLSFHHEIDKLITYAVLPDYFITNIVGANLKNADMNFVMKSKY